jgi:hypothetical protein
VGASGHESDAGDADEQAVPRRNQYRSNLHLGRRDALVALWVVSTRLSLSLRFKSLTIRLRRSTMPVS